MFRHSKRDGLLVGLMLLQLNLLLLPFLVNISLPWIVALTLVNTFLIGTNYQCVAHNFIHNPFFKSSRVNSFFSILNSFCLGVPSSVYRIHHLEHHRHNNRPDKDETSTYRHGKDGLEENIFWYSTLGVLRTDLGSLYKTARKQSSLVLVELILLLAFLIILVAVNWKLTLGYVLTSYLAGQIFALWENYCEHHHADYKDRTRDSVSCYNSVYNLVWFNNGYHQEHHYSPTIHWTQIPFVKEKLPKDRVVVRICHLSNSFNKFNHKAELK